MGKCSGGPPNMLKLKFQSARLLWRVKQVSPSKWLQQPDCNKAVKFLDSTGSMQRVQSNTRCILWLTNPDKGFFAFFGGLENFFFLNPKKLSVRGSHFSLAGHFVQRTSSPSPDILNYRRTFDYKKSGEYRAFRWGSIFAGHFFYLLLLDKMSGEIKHLRHTFIKLRMSGESGEFRVLWKSYLCFSYWA